MIQQLRNISGFKYYFFGIWLLLGLFQISVTGLIDDEAYYWVYAQNIDWGHFHQPPMVALWIKMGYSLFANEFGVRLMFLLGHLGTLILMERMIEKKDDALFVAIVSSFFLLHIAGFVAVPDGPFVFFTALFLYLTKQYLIKDSWQLMVALGFTIACLFYSKYHSILIVFFTMIANLQLFKRTSFYGIGIIALLVFFPHLYWQWEHDFISVMFHFFERTKVAWHIGLTLEFLGGTLLVFGPILSILLLVMGFRYKPENQFERTLKFVLIGVIAFFFVMSLRGRVEANWVVSAIIPCVILVHKSLLTQHPNRIKWVYYTLPLSLALAFAARFVIVYDVLPNDKVFGKVYKEYHGWEKWADEIESLAGDHPVFFVGSYQKPSRYQWHKGKIGHGFSPVVSPQTQFDLYDHELNHQGDTVLYILNFFEGKMDSIQTNRGQMWYRLVDNYRSYSYIDIHTENDNRTFHAKPNETISIPITMTSEVENVELDINPKLKSYFGYRTFQYGWTIDIGYTKDLVKPYFDGQKTYIYELTAPKKKGKYKFNLTIQTGEFYPLHNTPRYTLVVE